MQGFIGKTLQVQASINKAHITPYTINSLQVYGQEKYLLVIFLNSIACKKNSLFTFYTIVF